MMKLNSATIATKKARIEAYETVLKLVSSEVDSAEWYVEHYEEKIAELKAENEDVVDYDITESYEYEILNSYKLKVEAFKAIYSEIEKLA